MKETTYPVLTVKDGKVYLDGTHVRGVAEYAISRGDPVRVN